MDDDTDDTTETDAKISAPNGCDACIMGVELLDGFRMRACAFCSHTPPQTPRNTSQESPPKEASPSDTPAFATTNSGIAPNATHPCSAC